MPRLGKTGRMHRNPRTAGGKRRSIAHASLSTSLIVFGWPRGYGDCFSPASRLRQGDSRDACGDRLPYRGLEGGHLSYASLTFFRMVARVRRSLFTRPALSPTPRWSAAPAAEHPAGRQAAADCTRPPGTRRPSLRGNCRRAQRTQGFRKDLGK
jgi:hypothetical protein